MFIYIHVTQIIIIWVKACLNSWTSRNKITKRNLILHNNVKSRLTFQNTSNCAQLPSSHFPLIHFPTFLLENSQERTQPILRNSKMMSQPSSSNHNLLFGNSGRDKTLSTTRWCNRLNTNVLAARVNTKSCADVPKTVEYYENFVDVEEKRRGAYATGESSWEWKAARKNDEVKVHSSRAFIRV